MQVSERTALFYLFATMTLWAGNAIVGRMFYEELPAFQLAFWRWVLAGLLVLVIMRPPLRQDWPVIWAHKWTLLFIATFGIGCYNTLQYAALHHTTATNVGLIQTAMPVLVAILDRLVYRSSTSWLQSFGMGLSTFGVVVVIAQGDMTRLLDLSVNIGDFYMVLAILTYGIFSVSLRAAPKINQWSYLFVLFVIGAAELFPLQSYEYMNGARMQLTTGSMLAITYIVIGPAFLAYKFFTSAVATLGPNRAGVFFYWLPIAAAGLAVPLLGEALYLYHFVGFVLVVLGLRFGLQGRKNAAPK
ncbi:MAG: DMT family transporter [Candidatus Puniceispirillaceae bacterium]